MAAAGKPPSHVGCVIAIVALYRLDTKLLRRRERAFGARMIYSHAGIYEEESPQRDDRSESTECRHPTYNHRRYLFGFQDAQKGRHSHPPGPGVLRHPFPQGGRSKVHGAMNKERHACARQRVGELAVS